MLKHLTVLGALMAAASPAWAHPHAFIDVAVELVFDGAGRLAALREIWLFDEPYTAFATDGPGKMAAKLDSVTAENLKNLRDYGYFTRIEKDGKRVPTGKAAEPRTRLDGKRMEMSFLLPLAEPLKPAGRVTYSIYDPTYYSEMLHAEGSNSIRLTNAPAGCRTTLIEPQPPAETVTLARALDRSQSAGDGLGAYFAQMVEIACP